MPAFKKLVIIPREQPYITPDGPSLVTPQRVLHWHQDIQDMLAAGIKIPIPWGHQSKAEPEDAKASADTKQFHASQFNAGKFTGSEVDPISGGLIVHGDAPGVTQISDGTLTTQAELKGVGKVTCSIDDVSIASRDWMDGDGRLWKDCPIHLALTPLPVWHNQPGFKPSDQAPLAAGTVRFSLLQRFAVEDFPPAGKRDDAEPPEKKDDAPPEKKDAPDTGNSMRKALKALEGLGLMVGDDATPENVWDRIMVACETKNAAEGASMPDTSKVTTPAPTEATMMSLIGSNPLVASLVARVTDEERAKRLTRIAALEKRGLKPALAKGLRDEATAVRFAVDVSGKPVKAEVDAKLMLLEETLPEQEWSVLRQMSTEVEPPEGEKGKKYEAIADTMARAAGLPKRKTA